MEDNLRYEVLSIKHLEGLIPLWQNKEVIKYTNIKNTLTKEESKQRIERLVNNQEGLDKPTMFTIYKENKICGVIGCPVIDKENKLFGLFYQIIEEYWGKGIGKQAAQFITTYMKENYKGGTLFADVVIENYASVKILEKSGFKVTKVHENEFLIDDKKMHIVDYELKI